MSSVTGRLMVLLGLAIALAGALVLLLCDRLPGAGRLPGDILIRRRGFTFYFPLGACLAASVVLTLLAWLVGLLRR